MSTKQRRLQLPPSLQLEAEDEDPHVEVVEVEAATDQTAEAAAWAGDRDASAAPEHAEQTRVQVDAVEQV